MIPLTVICGYLGSGKTTLINNILQSTKKPIGVLVNDFGELNIDEQLILNQDDLTIALTNGCVCCNLNDDLGASLEFMLDQDIDAVLLESSGVALPVKMSNYGSTWPGYNLNQTITVVEGRTIKDLLSDKFVSRTVEAQIIQSDLIYLNRFSTEDVELISKLNSEYLVDDEKEILYESIFDIKNLLLKSKGLPYEDHNQLKSDVLQINHPIDEKTIRKFIRENPGIERLKGWISDSDKNTWLVQKTRSECNFSISNYETISRLVVIYKDKINLETLGI
ncbi:MAG: GTP-binding protein [SAR86 cluster bacterium]|nr:GTP-binding protein [SAR86 cluster bacterium]